MRALVTGATGFIGRRLVRRLAATGAPVFAGVAPDETPERVAALPEQAHRLTFDLRDGEAVESALAQAAPQLVFHLAALGVTDPGVDLSLALAVNVGGALHVLEAMRKRASGHGDVQRIVLVGTCHEYGARETSEGLDPFNAYAASKVAAWAYGRMYWRAYGLPTITVRPFQVYGPGQPEHTLIPAAIRRGLMGQDFFMTPGEQERDFIYVDDVVEGMVAAAVAPGIDGHSVDLGTGWAHPIYQVVDRIWAETGARGRILRGELPYRPGEVKHLVADADRTAQMTGWRAQVSLEEGLKETVRWYKESFEYNLPTTSAPGTSLPAIAES
jgi:nucleoside-diphosphate-sugar epimerase